MRLLITCMDGYELHLYIDDEWQGYMDFDTAEDAKECAHHWLEIGGLS